MSLDKGLALISSSRDWLPVLGYGLGVAFVTTILALLLCLAAILALLRLRVGRGRDLRVWMLLLQVPVAVPYALAAVLIFLLFYPGGPLGFLFPVMLGSAWGMIIAYLYKVTAFLILVAYPALLRTRDDELDQMSLQAKPTWPIFRYVLLPRLAPALLTGCCMIFAYVFAAYEIPFILGGRHPKMPALVVTETMDRLAPGSMQAGYLMGVILLAVIAAVCLAVWLAWRLWSRRRA